MSNPKIAYTELKRETSYSCPILQVDTLQSRAPDGHIESFTSIECGNFAIVIPILTSGTEETVLMVTQWRHGYAGESLEFPGGMLNCGENPAEGASRECREETGYVPGKITLLGELSQNPALFTNRFFVYLAEDLQHIGTQDLDPNEYIQINNMKLDDVIDHIGEPPLISGHTAAALTLLQKYRRRHTV